jgi:hypothetical protein
MYIYTIYVDHDGYENAIEWVVDYKGETPEELKVRAEEVLRRVRVIQPEAMMRRSLVPGI